MLFREELKRIESVVNKVLSENSNYTGQITIEVHCKDGIIKDVYVGNRSKIEK